MKFSALNVDFNSVSFDPIRSKRSPYESIKFGNPLQNARFLLLSSNLAREQLQIDTDLLRIITSTADELSGGTTSMTLNDFKVEKIACFSEFFAILHCDVHSKSKVLPKLLDIRLPSRTWGAGRPHAGLCPEFLVYFKIFSQSFHTLCVSMHADCESNSVRH